MWRDRRKNINNEKEVRVEKKEKEEPKKESTKPQSSLCACGGTGWIDTVKKSHVYGIVHEHRKCSCGAKRKK